MPADALNPTGAAQPDLNAVYETQGNAASKEPAEAAAAQRNATDASKPVDKRLPQKQANDDEATPTSVARGVRGAPPGEEAPGHTHEEMGRNKELDADQMAAPGEGKIADAVTEDEKSGAGGKEQNFASDLDRKKAEQAPAREKVQAEEKKEFDVGGILGQRGGPANPVDKEGYPNGFTIVAAEHPGYEAVAAQILTDNFTSISDSVNFVDTIPLNTTMTTSRAQLLEQEAKLPPTGQITDLFISHTCNTITWYFDFGTTPLPTRGIAILFVNADKKIYKAYREVNSGAILYNVGALNWTVTVGAAGPVPSNSTCKSCHKEEGFCD
ncbi:hypothetical protein LTR08_008661 [Meristemomyces frigidus]|nr:hypothetical protein LTR08_008661 [Meristemomyces frigidus]